ncbi:hypothetical protein [Nonomuraea sp. NPDC005650]|uniref:hypothetical protein n=1 Tax=Nonomuraea sp. NPDC005650 TaxID=3157045 RepID=UPI0033BA167A
MSTDKPVRHRAPVLPLHKDGSECKHRQKPVDPECPGRTGYSTTCSAGDFTLTNGIRAYVEEQARHHVHTNDPKKVTR